MNPEMDSALKELRQSVGDAYVIDTPEDLIVFEYDGAVDKATPLAVVIPETAQQVSKSRGATNFQLLLEALALG